MHLVDTDTLVEEGLINERTARVIAERSRERMMAMAINSVLCLGILAATLGLIFFLASPLPVAVLGLVFLISGAAILRSGATIYGMFGNAASLIGSGMLIGGAAFEIYDKAPETFGPFALIAGAVIVGVCAVFHQKGTALFVTGAILLMGLALHLAGIGDLLDGKSIPGGVKALIFLYATITIAASGWMIDVRFVTALAIIPFAQVLETGSAYFHAAYVFYSPEPSLTILQMVVAVVVTLWLVTRTSDHIAHHLYIFAIIAFIVANLAALVGSLWGDTLFSSWGPRRGDFDGWDAYRTARDAYQENLVHISEHVFSIVWAIALIAIIFWAATTLRRGLLNAGLTFGAIHAYTQMFESFADEPLAYVIGGLAAIPLAWGIWRLNQHFTDQEKPNAPD